MSGVGSTPTGQRINPADVSKFAGHKRPETTVAMYMHALGSADAVAEVLSVARPIGPLSQSSDVDLVYMIGAGAGPPDAGPAAPDTGGVVAGDDCAGTGRVEAVVPDPSRSTAAIDGQKKYSPPDTVTNSVIDGKGTTPFA
jgi:hypothetical protein